MFLSENQLVNEQINPLQLFFQINVLGVTLMVQTILPFIGECSKVKQMSFGNLYQLILKMPHKILNII